MRSEFIANASHELRTPLAALKGFIETLQGAAKDDPTVRERFLGIMAKQADRMAELIDNLLSLSRIEMDEHVRPTGKVDLFTVARTVAAALQPLADAAGVVLEVTLPESLPRAIGEHDQLVQVLQNLIDNAIKYGASGGRVTIEAGIPAAPGQVAVAVRDHGEGIARTHLPRLTERFYRIDDARSRERGGTGLGLAIVKHVVNRHNGRLMIDSEPGRGSVFTVSLPAASASGWSAAVTVRAAATRSTCPVGRTCSSISMRLSDRRSSISRAMRPVWSCMMVRNRSRAAASLRAGLA
jgi:two-component system phosphate regulon sensor histidine kinase PhoR